METPVDPLVLLKALAAMLNIKGGVNGSEEMEKMIKLMKNAKQLVSRCVYLNILRVTESAELLNKFVSNGGWTVMNAWLSDAKKVDNMPLILEILKLLHRLPLKIDHLKQNNTPKIVKALAKSCSCPKVKVASGQLMGNWLSIIRDTSGPSSTDAKKKEKPKLQKNKAEKVTKKESLKSKDHKPPPVARAPSFAKFRKTGLETDEPVKKSQKTAVAGKRSSIESDDSNIPDKKIKQEPKLAKKISISEGFMDALNSIPLPVKRQTKRKPVKGKPSSTSPVHKPSPVHETTTGAAGDFDAMETEPRSKSPSPIPMETKPSKPKLNKYGLPQKTVRWVQDSHLESVRYFEVEEGERGSSVMERHRQEYAVEGRLAYQVNVTTQNFKDAIQRDRMMEREGLGEFHHKGQSSWRKPQLIDLPAPLVEIGSNSVENDIQTEREKTVLQEIFLTQEMVPDSPAEPDPEPYDMIPPKIIPTEDPNDPGPPSASPTTASNTNPVTNAINGLMGKEGGKEDIKDKLREIIQTATAAKDSKTANANQPSAAGEVYPQGQMPPNGMDPNMMYMVPSGGNGFYPPGPMMMPPPGMMPPMGGPEQYPMEWSGGHGPPPNMPSHRPPGNGPRPPHFQPMYNRNDNWRPRKPWMNQNGSRGRWNRGNFRR